MNGKQKNKIVLILIINVKFMLTFEKTDMWLPIIDYI